MQAVQQAPVQESVPYDVLIGQMETALHRAQSENVMLNARIAVRDQALAEKDVQIARLLEQLSPAPAAAEEQHEHQAQRLPPPARQEPVPQT